MPDDGRELNELTGMADLLHRYFCALVLAGFTEAQSVEIVGGVAREIFIQSARAAGGMR